MDSTSGGLVQPSTSKATVRLIIIIRKKKNKKKKKKEEEDSY